MVPPGGGGCVARAGAGGAAARASGRPECLATVCRTQKEGCCRSSEEWGEPIVAERKPAHNFELEPTLVGLFQRTDQIKTTDRDTGEPRMATIHRFLGDDGPVDAWGTSHLDDLLRAVAPGSRVRVQYFGRETLPNGNEIKRFEVRVAKGYRPPNPDAPPPDDDIPF